MTYLSFLRRLFRDTGQGMGPLCLPIVPSLIAASLEGISFALLVPLVHGLVRLDFSEVPTLPGIRLVWPLLESVFGSSGVVQFFALTAMIFVVAMGQALMSYVASIWTRKEMLRFDVRLRQLLYERMTRNGKLFFDEHDVGHLALVLNRYTRQVSTSITSLQLFVSAMLMMVSYLVVMVAISWELTAFSLLVLPVLYVVLTGVIGRVRGKSRQIVESQRELRKKSKNMLLAAPLIQANAKEQREAEAYRRNSEALAALQLEDERLRARIEPIQSTVMLTATLCLAGAVGVLLEQGGADVSNYLVFFVILRRATGRFGALNRLRVTVAGLKGPVEEIEALIVDRGRYVVQQGTAVFDGLRRAIRFESLSFEYREAQPVLRDVSFEIERGKVTALVGPTGSGKTTVAHLLLRLYDCAPGSLTIDGRDVRDFTLQSVRGQMALVEQDALVINGSVRGNIVFGVDRDVPEEELHDVSRRARLHDDIMALPEGYETRVGDRGATLSGGQRQRLAIARALLRDPAVLVLDEATSALDPATERQVQEAVEELLQGRTAVVIAHRLSTIENAHHLVVLDDGRVAEQGRFEDLREGGGIFQAMWQAQRLRGGAEPDAGG